MSRLLDQPTQIWLTGAGSGIGEAIARRLVRDGHHLVISGRRREPLDAIASMNPEQVQVAPADTTRTEDLQQVSNLLNEGRPLQLAILNAGTCEYIDVDQFSADTIAANIETNVLGTARSIEMVLPLLRKTRAQGLPAALVIVSSSAWWFPFGRAEGYGASKAALTYLAHSLRADLAAEGIEVIVVSPGFVKTPLTDRNDFPMPFLIDAETAAERTVRGLRQGKKDIEFPKRFTWTLRLLGNLPQGLIDRMAASMSKKSS